EIYDKERSLVERISSLKTGMERFSQKEDVLGVVAGRLGSIVCDLQDMAETLRVYSNTIDLDPESLELLNQRMDLISKLKRKYGGSLSSLFEQYEAMRADLDDTQGLDERILTLSLEKEALEQQVRQKAGALSMARKKAGKKLAELAKKELAALEMGKAQFEVVVSHQASDNPEDICTKEGEKIFATGMDKICFMLSPNLGEAPRPLAKIASGGELSRIVLALKAVLSTTQSLETLIFDEVDAGIGGATSEKVGIKLKELGEKHQVICITHLAQIAKYGANQFRISKQVVNGRTCTTILPLETRKERVEEIARMIGGQEITPATLTHAEELLGQARS
ncbi:MAG: DNA repair protein RecN, partial [Proteobacteria bacterium]|nr:DNA repair protein RecN [Pseudomonadota bacterium]